MIKLLGIVGGFFFAYCGVPAAYGSLKTGKSFIPPSTSLMILGGALAMYAYLTLSYGFDAILTVNYSVEALSWGIIGWYHYFPRKTAHEKIAYVKPGEFPKMMGLAEQIELAMFTPPRVKLGSFESDLLKKIDRELEEKTHMVAEVSRKIGYDKPKKRTKRKAKR